MTGLTQTFGGILAYDIEQLWRVLWGPLWARKAAEGESQPAEIGQLLLPPAQWDNIQPWVSFICPSQLRNTMFFVFYHFIYLFIYSSNNKLAALFNCLISHFSL